VDIKENGGDCGRGTWTGRFRFRFPGIRRKLETEPRGATWPRRGAQGRGSPSPSANSRRCRNTRPLGRLGAEILSVSGLTVQKCEGFGPSRCIHAACFEPVGKGMPHRASAMIRRKSAYSSRLGAVPGSRPSMRSAILGPKHAAEMPLVRPRARAWAPLGALPSSDRPLEERRTLARERIMLRWVGSPRKRECRRTAFPDGARNASARFYRPPCSHYGRGVA